MSKFNWNETTNRLAALREQIDGEQTQVENDQPDGDPEVAEELSPTQVAALAEMLDVDVEELLKADEETIAEAMEYLGYKLLNASYGRPGLSGKYPWSKNDAQVGYSLQHAAPSTTGEPGEKTAKPPKDSSSPMAMRPKVQPT